MDKLDKKIEYSLFQPKKQRSLFFTYPELKDNPDLIHLENNKAKLLFCYYLGCDTSPLKPHYLSDNIQKKVIAVQKALNHSGLINRIKDDELSDYLDMDFPAEITKGIKGFLIYQANARVRAKMKMEKILHNWEIILDKDIEGEEFFVVDKKGDRTGERDFQKIKQHNDIVASIRKDMKQLIADIEYGFGLTEKEQVSSDGEDISFTDLKHEGLLS